MPWYILSLPVCPILEYDEQNKRRTISALNNVSEVWSNRNKTRYGQALSEHVALIDLNLDISKGEFIIDGSSRSEKSTHTSVLEYGIVSTYI